MAKDVAELLDIDPTGSNPRNIDKITHDVLVYLARCRESGMSDQDILCAWHFISTELSGVMDNTAHETRH